MGLCEQVLPAYPAAFTSSETSVVVVNDLAKSDTYAQRPYVAGAPHFRFFAGAPLISPKFTVVGALSIYDGQPRNGLPEQGIMCDP